MATAVDDAAVTDEEVTFEAFLRDIIRVDGVVIDDDGDDADADADDERGEFAGALAEEVQGMKRHLEHHHHRGFGECDDHRSCGKVDDASQQKCRRAAESSPGSDAVIAPPTSSVQTTTTTTTTDTTDTAEMMTAQRKRPCDGDSQRASAKTGKRGRPRWSILSKDDRDFGLERLTNVLMLPAHEAAEKLGLGATTFKARYEAMKMYAGVNLSENVGQCKKRSRGQTTHQFL